MSFRGWFGCGACWLELHLGGGSHALAGAHVCQLGHGVAAAHAGWCSSPAAADAGLSGSQEDDGAKGGKGRGGKPKGAVEGAEAAAGGADGAQQPAAAQAVPPVAAAPAT